MIPKYKIGDAVWRATFGSSENYVTCHDCGGTGRLRVIFHDETVASIECRNCALGYDPPTGRVRCYDRIGKADLGVIAGIELTTERVSYRFGSDRFYYTVEEHELFDTEAAALARAQQIAAEHDAEERNRILTKEKDTRTWAWNASYHRQCIKRAQRDLEYHTAKLSVAKVRAKEPVV